MTAEHIERYIERVLHQRTKLRAWSGAAVLPVFLSSIYDFFKAEIAGVPCLFMTQQEGRNAPTPAEIAKHIGLIKSETTDVVIYGPSKLNATMRARLIDAGIAFIAPGNQLYIPQLAMDLREHFRAPKTARPDKLSPSSQLVLFYMLLQYDAEEEETPSYLADRLGYSLMTMGRAIDELVAVGLATSRKLGRERYVSFNAHGRTLLDMAKTLLKSPVSKRAYVIWNTKPSEPPIAGLTALAERTDLNDDGPPCYAVSREQWKDLITWDTVSEVYEPYEAETIIETWKYDPLLLSDHISVDPLSLYASYWDSEDERIAVAAEQLVERWQW